jgi:ubiquinone/menaquinone biosynthesis C-methylase UbiE
MSELEDLAILYDKRVKELGYAARSVGWQSKEQQNLRFQMLTENISLAGQSVVDLGCGFGDFYEFLCSSDMTPSKYVGIDISDEMLKVAKEIHSEIPGVTFINRPLMDSTQETYDFAVASGSLNYNLKVDMDLYLKDFLEVYKLRVRKGLLLNLLTTKVDYMQEMHVHYSPDFVRELFLKHFEKVRVIEGYGLYEFTIQALK